MALQSLGVWAGIPNSLFLIPLRCQPHFSLSRNFHSRPPSRYIRQKSGFLNPHSELLPFEYFRDTLQRLDRTTFPPENR